MTTPKTEPTAQTRKRCRIIQVTDRHRGGSGRWRCKTMTILRYNGKPVCKRHLPAANEERRFERWQKTGKWSKP